MLQCFSRKEKEKCQSPNQQFFRGQGPLVSGFQVTVPKIHGGSSSRLVILLMEEILHPWGCKGCPAKNGQKLDARLIGVRDVLCASVLLRNILKSKYYWEVGNIDKYVFWGSIYIGENDDTL